MSATKYIFIICAIVIGALSNSTISSADTPARSGADFLVEVGEQHYHAGEMDFAIHEFRKALMLNPDHEKARQYLQELGVSSTNTYSTDLTHHNEMARLAKHIQFQNEKISALTGENDYLAKEFHVVQGKNKDLKEDNLRKKMEIKRLQHNVRENESQFEKLQQDQLDQIQELTSYYKNAAFEEQIVEIDKEVLQAKYYHALELAMEQEERMAEMVDENQKLHGYVDGQYAYQDHLIRVLEDYVNMRERQITDLRTDVTVAQINEAKAEIELLVKISEMIGMNEDYRQRLRDLNQHLETIQNRS